MPQPSTLSAPALLLPLLATLLTACAATPPALPVLVKPNPVPPLPAQARQPSPPAICLPTCSDGLTRLRGSLQSTQTAPASPGSPASVSTTR